MKLSDVVAQHGYQLSELGEIEKARLYERRNADGALELLCELIPRAELEGYLEATLAAA